MSVIKGLVLLAAVAFDLLSKQQDRPPLFPSLGRKKHKSAEPPRLAETAVRQHAAS